jgi:hypothetical protein
MFNLLEKIFLTSVCLVVVSMSAIPNAHAKNTPAVYTNQDVTMRYHAQWTIDEAAQKKRPQHFEVRFDSKGHPVPEGLSPFQQKRWETFYKLCMGDGCYYCDAMEGSCESNTCGDNNEYCKPYLGANGQPVCGKVCADYAFYASSDA